MADAAKKLDDDTEQAPVGKRIDAADARELRWYFSDPAIAGVGSGGTLGAMLERASVMAVQLVPCARCGGDRATDKPGSGWCAKGGGNYQKALKRYWRDDAKRRGLRLCADIESAQGWRKLGPEYAKFVAGEEIAEALPDNLTKRCVQCEGSGMVQRRRNNRTGPQTVKSTGSSVHGDPDAATWIDEQALARYGSIARLLDRARERSLLARAALAVYFAPAGGSIGSLWPLTDEGRRFWEETPNPQRVPPEALMQNERESNRVSPSVARTVMFSKIARQCADVWDETCAVWAQVSE
jgi:hypothetical protein